MNLYNLRTENGTLTKGQKNRRFFGSTSSNISMTSTGTVTISKSDEPA
jgi:hypothetical protein